MDQINLVTRNAIDTLDRFPGFVYKHRRVVLTVTAVAVVLVLFKYQGILGSSRPPALGEGCEQKAFALAKYMARESAKLVAVALEKRSTRLLEAYESATQAAVMARMAKEVDPDTDRLSKELGVDFLEYIIYTGNVLAELRARLMSSSS